MKVLILEKAQKFGGTSAVSGGVMWIPNHQLDGDAGDSRGAALEYLNSIITKPVNRTRLEAFVDTAPAMLHYIKGAGVEVIGAAWPDYEPLKPGARSDRSVIAPIFDGRELGDNRYDLMREQYQPLQAVRPLFAGSQRNVPADDAAEGLAAGRGQGHRALLGRPLDPLASRSATAASSRARR